MGGNSQFAQVRVVMVCSSAMEAISWLNNNYSSFHSLDNLLFLATGARLHDARTRLLLKHLYGRSFGLLFGMDLLGGIADLKVAAGIRREPVAVFSRDERVQVVFRSAVYDFDEAEFSLPAFEKASKFRFKVPAYKPKGYNSFFEQLKANPNLIY